ncbi:MAG: hypothetical protein QRY71_04815 [Candidatus Rhabdochlamydia sp.]
MSIQLDQAIRRGDADQVKSILDQTEAFPPSLIESGITLLINQDNPAVTSLMNIHRNALNQNAERVTSLFKQLMTHASQERSLLFSLNSIETMVRIFDVERISFTPNDQETLGALSFQLIKQVKIFSNFPQALDRIEDASEQEGANENAINQKIDKLFNQFICLFPDFAAAISTSSSEKLEHLEKLENSIPYINDSGNHLNEFLLLLFSKIPHLMKVNQKHGLGHLLFYTISKQNKELAEALMDHPRLPEIMSHIQEDGKVISYGFFELLKELIEFPLENMGHRYLPEKLLSKMTSNSQFKEQRNYSYSDLLEDLFSFDKELFNMILSLNKIQQLHKENFL